MKFLVFEKPIHGPPPTPEQMKANLEALEASVAILQDMKKKGKAECYYGLSGIQSGFAIINADSHEELNELITTLPITAFGQIEVHPLITVESALGTLKKALAQSRK